MNKSEMIKRMKDIVFKAQGVNLQLGAGHMLKGAAATTVEERGNHLDAGLYLNAPMEALADMIKIIMVIHPDHLEVDELPEPFCALETMNEEEIADWLVNEVKESKKQIEKGEKTND